MAESRVQPPPARMLSRADAAAYCGVSPTLFDKMSAKGLMPQAVRAGARILYDRHRLDAALDALSGASTAAPQPEDSNDWD